ncbi:MAG: TIGR02757 family protein [Muribaculaceae bacterium]|nr:TIGR02757 family protein [Muribaculaceae bacterium]
MDNKLKEQLDGLVAQYNVPTFADSDPVQFPRRYEAKRDIEISALLTSCIAWGRRPMILSNAEKLHGLLEHEPYRFVVEGDIDSVSDNNIHRTFFGRHLRYFLRGLREIYLSYGSLEDFAVKSGAIYVESAAWALANNVNEILRRANAQHPLEGPTRCLPDNVEISALKRFNMALRWLVRQDGIVDIGAWTALTPAQLFIPLDVHSANTSRKLGLLQRKQNDRRAVVELTEKLRDFNASDPTVYDFALFGAGVVGDL